MGRVKGEGARVKKGALLSAMDKQQVRESSITHNKYTLSQGLCSTGLAYLLFYLFFGHYAYVGKWRLQVFSWALCVVSVVSWMLYMITAGSLPMGSKEVCVMCRVYVWAGGVFSLSYVVWWCYALFTLRRVVEAWNQPIEEQLAYLDANENKDSVGNN